MDTAARQRMKLEGRDLRPSRLQRSFSEKPDAEEIENNLQGLLHTLLLSLIEQ